MKNWVRLQDIEMKVEISEDLERSTIVEKCEIYALCT